MLSYVASSIHSSELELMLTLEYPHLLDTYNWLECYMLSALLPLFSLDFQLLSGNRALFLFFVLKLKIKNCHLRWYIGYCSSSPSFDHVTHWVKKSSEYQISIFFKMLISNECSIDASMLDISIFDFIESIRRGFENDSN